MSFLNLQTVYTFDVRYQKEEYMLLPGADDTVTVFAIIFYILHHVAQARLSIILYFDLI